MHPLISTAQKEYLKKVPELKTGYTVRVYQKIKEAAKEGGKGNKKGDKEASKERIQAFEGLIIKVGHGEGVEKTFTVRKVVQGIGVEKVFPIHSPDITKIDVKKKATIHKAKLYYMRKRSGKSARLHERHVTDQERAEESAKMEALIQEAVEAEEKRKSAEEAAITDKAVQEEATAVIADKTEQEETTMESV